jgi:hypothetical protein
MPDTKKEDQLYDRTLYHSDGRTTRYRIDFVGSAESYMVGRAAAQSGGQAKFRQIRITVQPADRVH